MSDTMRNLRTPAIVWCFSAIGSCLCAAVLIAADAPTASHQVIDWKLDNLESIGGHRVTVVGEPEVVESDGLRAIEFDGVDDAIYVDANPLAGHARFTVEVVFRPASGGAKEQRFLHFQPTGVDDRLLFETRLPTAEEWFLDTFVTTSSGKQTLYAEQSRHRLDRWHHAAVIVDGRTMRHFVDGREELSADMAFTPFGPGQTSIGVRFNRVHWFRGQVRRIRVTPDVLPTTAFLQP